MPLRTTLENFINHEETLESKKSEGDDLYEKEFKLLKTLTESLRNLPQYSSHHGENEVNRKKNRYKDIVPYDYTRVTISSIPGVPTSDYVNASYIKGASGSMAYIASQGPLPSTVDDFWRMIWECEIQVIIMSCNEIEGGKRKCDKYWADRGEEKTFGNIKVKFIRIKQVCAEFVVRTMTATNAEQERMIVQFHYISWPDHGIPDSVKPILKMVKLVRGCQASETLPVLVHCSAGCGRTGTICAIDFVWGLLRTGKLTDDFSLFQLVSNMRKQRIAMVQTKEQYILVYRAVKELFEEHLQVMDSHPYENVDFSGTPIMFVEGVCQFIDDEDDNKNSIKTSISETGIEVPLINEVNDDGVTTDTENLTENSRTGSVQRLISTWNNSDNQLASKESSDSKTTSPSEHHYESISLYSTSTGSLATSPIESDLQPEKAVIVHKPSIARLRAIFEKSNAIENSNAEKNTEVNTMVPKRSKSKKINSSSDKRKLSKKGDRTAALRYRDTALTVYSEIRQNKEGLGIEITANIEIQQPLVPETPDFIRRDKPKRSSSIRRSSSSVWYDEEAQLKGGESEKPALPVKRSKSLKLLKQPSKGSSPTSLEVPVNGHEQGNQVDASTLPKGVIKLKSSPWNPRRSQSMKTSKSSAEKLSTKEKTKPWYLFSENEPDVVAGFDKEGIQLVQVKINADDKQLVFSEESGSLANTDKQVKELPTCTIASPVEETIAMAKEIEFTLHKPALEKNLWVPKVEKIKCEPQRARVEIRANSGTVEIDEDKPPPLPVKVNSPCNSPRLRHQEFHARNIRVKELGKTNLGPEKCVTKEIVAQIGGDNSEILLSCSSKTGDSNFPTSSIEKSKIVCKADENDMETADIPRPKWRSDEDDKSSETEDSYQQIIKDCQEYLITSGCINAVPKMNANLTPIENAIEKNPRSGFVDLTSGLDNDLTDASKVKTTNENDNKPVSNSDAIRNLLLQRKDESSPIPEEFFMAEDVQEIMRQIEADTLEKDESGTPNINITASKKHYEHLWLSRSGNLNSDDPSENEKQDYDLRSYKIVQQVLNSCKERDQIVSSENGQKKCKKPKPLPRRNLPPPKPSQVECCDIAGSVDFSSEDDESDDDGDDDGQHENSGDGDARHDCIYSEVLKEKPKITYQYRLYHGSKDDMYLLPSVPSRLKRQFSFQQPKMISAETEMLNFYKWRHTLPDRWPANTKKVKLKAVEKWGDEWISDEDCTPPVPEKTREAYMLPTDTRNVLKQSISQEEKSSATGTKSFTKFGILSKLGLKIESKGAEDANKIRQQASISNECLTEYAYPNRLAKKPQGPRNHPPEWTSNKSKVPS